MRTHRRAGGWQIAVVVAGLGAAVGCSSSGSPAPGGQGGTEAPRGVGGSSAGTGGMTAGTGGSGAGGTASTDGGPVDAPGDVRPPGDASGQAGATGAGGGGGAPSCAGRAVALAANVAGNNDPAMARVAIDFGTSTDLPTANELRTIEFWAFVRASSWVGDANTMFFYGTNLRRADGFGLDFGAQPATIDPFTNAIFDNDNQPSGVTATVDQWIHFAMSWDGSAVRAFVNGVERANKTATGAQTTLMTGRTPLIVGGYPPAFFNGQIDELRVWTIARTATEITSTMRVGLTGNERGLSGYWKFDEASGITAADSVTTAGHTAHPGTLMANNAGNLPTFVPSGAPILCR